MEESDGGSYVRRCNSRVYPHSGVRVEGAGLRRWHKASALFPPGAMKPLLGLCFLFAAARRGLGPNNHF